MPGTAGLVHFSPNISTEIVLFRMKSAMHRNTARHMSTVCHPNCGLACDTLEGSSSASQAGTTLVWTGVLNRPFELLQGCTPAETLLKSFQTRGPAALYGLNGQYAVAVWEEAHQRLTLINDRLGIQPLYYWIGPNQLAFASEIKAVAAHQAVSKEVNPTAVFELLAVGHMLDERTLYRDIVALPPAAHLTYERGQLQIRQYWQMPLYNGSSKTFPHEWGVNQFRDLVEQAVGRLPADLENALLLLTAGLDSGLLAYHLAKIDAHPVKTATIGHSLARDVIGAKAIAEKLGLDHVVLQVNPSFLADYAARAIQRTEGEMNLHAAWIFEMDGLLRQRGSKYVISGVGAEGIAGRHWLAEQGECDELQALQRLCGGHWQFGPAEKLFRPQFAREVWAESNASLIRSLREAPSDHPLSRFDYLHLRQHRRHPTGNLLQDYALPLEPFFDIDLVDFALSIPPDIRSRIYQEMVRKCMPGHVAPQSSASWGQNGKGIRNAVRRRLRRFFGFEIRSDDPTSTLYHNHWLRTESRDFVIHLLNQESYLEDLFQIDRVRALVADHMAGRRNEYRLLSALVTFVEWRRQAVGPVILQPHGELIREAAH